MGESKALLRFGRRTALQLAVENAARARVRHVVGVVGHRAEEVRAAHFFSGLPLSFEWALNLESDSPMLLSLQTGLRRIRSLRLDAFFFQPVDVPLIRPDDFSRLLDAFEGRLSDERVFIAAHGDRRGHPVLCHASLIDEFLALRRHQTPRDLLDAQPIVYVESGHAGVLEDMDTRDDYHRLRTVYESMHGDGREGSETP